MNIGRLRQSHTAIASAFPQLVYALLNTWPSYTSELYRSNTTTPLSAPMTTGEEALLGSLPSLGAMLGSAFMGLLINKIGRRNGGVLSSLPVLIAWGIIGLTTSIKYVLAARFLAGISGGAGLVLSPIFTSEVAEDVIRGTLASVAMFIYCGGVLLSFGIGACMTYRTIIWFNLVLSLICVILLALVTESPVYLLRRNRIEEAKLSIAKYRGVPVSSVQVLDEFMKLRQQIIKTSVKLVPIIGDIHVAEAEKERLKQEETVLLKPQSQSAIKLLFMELSSRRAFIVVAVVLSMQVYMGIIPVQVYAKIVFTESDPSQANTYTVLFAAVLLLGSCVTGVITDKVGRRLLIISSSILVFVCMTTLGYLAQSKAAPSLVTVVMIFAYSFFFMCGAGTIPYVLLAEVFVPEVQNLASMIIIELAWFHNFVIIGLFPIINRTFGIYGSFYIFGFVGLFNAIFSYFFMPETKGLSNIQIQRAFRKKK